MLTKNELLKAIEELEDASPTFQNCQKMATFYTLLNAIYRSGGEANQQVELIREEVINEHGNSDFLRMLDGMNSHEAWLIMDELMDTILILQPKLYDSVMRRIRGEV